MAVMHDPPGARDFATTHWSLVAASQSDDASATRARRALEALCRAYWYPLYAFVRFRGFSADDAQDLTQAFFARIVETRGLSSADPQRGRFRSYLLGALKHFLANEGQKARTLKRGGGARFVGWDDLDAEARYAGTATRANDPELLFDREWAQTITQGALESLRCEMARAGKSVQFQALQGTLAGEEVPSRAELAERLEMTEGAVKVAIHRLRQRYRALLRSAVAETVSTEADLEDEMRYLVTVLRRE